jgi:hypothetical protein
LASSAISGSISDAIQHSTTCSEYLFGECAAVGSYRIDIYGDGVIDNVPVIANPIPPALPLFASVAALLGYFGRKRSAA